jgi:hypothetical protein
LHGCDLLANFTIAFDLQKHAMELIGVLIEAVDIGRQDFSERIFLILGRVLERFPLDDALSRILNYFFALLRSDDLDDDEGISDHALIAFTKFLRANIGHLDTDVALHSWANCFPLWGAPDDCDVVFQFLADVLDDGNGDCFGPDWLGEVIQNIIAGEIQGQISSQTGIRLCNFLRRLLADGDAAAVIGAKALDLVPSRRDILDVMLGGDLSTLFIRATDDVVAAVE